MKWVYKEKESLGLALGPHCVGDHVGQYPSKRAMYMSGAGHQGKVVGSKSAGAVCEEDWGEKGSREGARGPLNALSRWRSDLRFSSFRTRKETELTLSQPGRLGTQQNIRKLLQYHPRYLTRQAMQDCFQSTYYLRLQPAGCGGWGKTRYPENVATILEVLSLLLSLLLSFFSTISASRVVIKDSNT